MHFFKTYLKLGTLIMGLREQEAGWATRFQNLAPIVLYIRDARGTSN